jgi:predicted Zn-dependent protease
MIDRRREEDRTNPLPAGGKEDYQEALNRYGQILARDPASLVFAALAEEYRKRGELDKAIAICRKGLRLHPRYISGRVALARAYADDGKLDLARQELEKVVLSAPDNIVAQKLLADIYKQGGHMDLLEKTSHRILALDGADAQAREGLEWVRRKRKNGGADAEKTGQTTEIVTRTLADIYAAQGHFHRAYEIYEELSLGEPSNPLFHERLAELKEKLIVRNGRRAGKEEGEK